MIGGNDLCAVRARDGVAVDAAIARQHDSALVELRCSGQRVLVALAATRLNVTGGQNRLFAGSFAVMRLGDGRGRSLAAMADDASESVERVRNCGVFAEGLLIHIAKTGFIQSKMAGRAAVDHTQFRKPDLMDARLKASAQADRIPAIVNQCKIVALIAMPLGGMVFGRSDGKRQQQDQADDTECPHRIAEEGSPRRGEILFNRSHLTPPGQDPGPTRAAEPCTNGGEHNEFEQKPRHDPVSERLLRTDTGAFAKANRACCWRRRSLLARRARWARRRRTHGTTAERASIPRAAT